MSVFASVTRDTKRLNVYDQIAATFAQRYDVVSCDAVSRAADGAASMETQQKRLPFGFCMVPRKSNSGSLSSPASSTRSLVHLRILLILLSALFSMSGAVKTQISQNFLAIGSAVVRRISALSSLIIAATLQFLRSFRIISHPLSLMGIVSWLITLVMLSIVIPFTIATLRLQSITLGLVHRECAQRFIFTARRASLRIRHGNASVSILPSLRCQVVA